VQHMFLFDLHNSNSSLFQHNPPRMKAEDMFKKKQQNLKSQLTPSLSN